MQDPLVIVGFVLLPDATPARKNADKLHWRLSAHSSDPRQRLSLHSSVPHQRLSLHSSVPHQRLSLHSSGVLAAATVLLLINLGAPAFEPPHHSPDALRKRFQHLDNQMHMVRHHHLCQHFKRIAFPFVELRQPTKHLTHAPSEGVKPDTSRFSTIAF
ncbi:MAG: hypothetical protein II822_08350 [Prevotella sp.]|nr:hypothetical protein [Prevotella sp.]